METKNKIVRYSESFRTDSEIKEPWHYKSMERTVDGVYVVPEIYIPLHRSFGQRITQKEAEAICSEYGLSFPSREEIEMLEVAYDAAKSQFSEIPEYTDCWTSDGAARDETERKFLILFCYEAGTVKLIKHRYVLVDEKELYQYVLGIWLRPSPELLLGDKFSNLFQTQDHDLFLQKEQKLTYVGGCNEIWYDEIILSSTGLYQYADGEMRRLVKVRLKSVSAKMDKASISLVNENITDLRKAPDLFRGAFSYNEHKESKNKMLMNGIIIPLISLLKKNDFLLLTFMFIPVYSFRIQ